MDSGTQTKRPAHLLSDPRHHIHTALPIPREVQVLGRRTYAGVLIGDRASFARLGGGGGGRAGVAALAMCLTSLLGGASASGRPLYRLLHAGGVVGSRGCACVCVNVSLMGHQGGRDYPSGRRAKGRDKRDIRTGTTWLETASATPPRPRQGLWLCVVCVRGPQMDQGRRHNNSAVKARGMDARCLDAPKRQRRSRRSFWNTKETVIQKPWIKSKGKQVFVLVVLSFLSFTSQCTT